MKVGEFWEYIYGEDDWIDVVQITDIIYNGSGEDTVQFGNETGGMELKRKQFLRTYRKLNG